MTAMAVDDTGEHGTYGRHQRHLKDGEPSCPACRAAATAYQREWRKTSAGLRSRQRDIRRGRQHDLAIQELIRRYRREFTEILIDIQGSEPTETGDE